MLPLRARLPLLGALSLLLLVGAAPAQAQTQVFTYTGADQSFTVPAGITQITIKAWGAGGGAANNEGSAGGGGGFTQAILPVTPGENLTIIVGERGIRGGGDVGIRYGGGGGNSSTAAGAGV